MPVKSWRSVDVVFPVLHGPYGEDGTIQGLLELAGVPYVGAGVLSSAVGMDKEFTKKLLVAEGLPVGPYAVLRPSQQTLPRHECERLGLPVFVKPARGGSSIGVTRVARWDELAAAVADARRHDPKVIVEAAINGRELECGVLEMPDGTMEASTVGEIRVAGVRGREDGFYDFVTKYLDDAAELDVPAKIDDDIADAVRQLAIRAFRAIDCQGLARVDFFLTDDGPVINEVNTMPGFTTISMYPRMWAASGVDYPSLLATMVETALGPGRGSALTLTGPGGIDGHRRDGAVDHLGELLDRCRPRSRRQGQREIHRPIHRVPGGSACVTGGLLFGRHLEPLHPVDDLDRRIPPRNSPGGRARSASPPARCRARRARRSRLRAPAAPGARADSPRAAAAGAANSARHAALPACGAGTAGTATGCGGAWRVAAMTRTMPIAATASGNRGDHRARGGPPGSSVSESITPGRRWQSTDHPGTSHLIH